MTRTSTKIVNFETLDPSKESNQIVVQLMMACSDMQRANQAQAHFQEIESPQKIGQLMYFVRLQFGHLFEGLKIIEKIKIDEELNNLVQKSDETTKESFDFLVHFFPDGAKRKDLEKWIGRVRHNITFHYSDCNKLISKALDNRKKGIGSKTSSITRADTAHSWHFKIADDLVDSIVCRQIWKISENENLREEADKILEQAHKIFLKFMDFSGEFIWNYYRQ